VNGDDDLNVGSDGLIAAMENLKDFDIEKVCAASLRLNNV